MLLWTNCSHSKWTGHFRTSWSNIYRIIPIRWSLAVMKKWWLNTWMYTVNNLHTSVNLGSCVHANRVSDNNNLSIKRWNFSVTSFLYEVECAGTVRWCYIVFLKTLRRNWKNHWTKHLYTHTADVPARAQTCAGSATASLQVHLVWLKAPGVSTAWSSTFVPLSIEELSENYRTHSSMYNSSLSEGVQFSMEPSAGVMRASPP